jgi:hypothetical protein
MPTWHPSYNYPSSRRASHVSRHVRANPALFMGQLQSAYPHHTRCCGTVPRDGGMLEARRGGGVGVTRVGSRGDARIQIGESGGGGGRGDGAPGHRHDLLMWLWSYERPGPSSGHTTPLLTSYPWQTMWQWRRRTWWAWSCPWRAGGRWQRQHQGPL